MRGLEQCAAQRGASGRRELEQTCLSIEDVTVPARGPIRSAIPLTSSGRKPPLNTLTRPPGRTCRLTACGVNLRVTY